MRDVQQSMENNVQIAANNIRIHFRGLSFDRGANAHPTPWNWDVGGLGIIGRVWIVR